MWNLKVLYKYSQDLLKLGILCIKHVGDADSQKLILLLGIACHTDPLGEGNLICYTGPTNPNFR